MEAADILDALAGIADTLSDAAGQLAALQHRLEELRGNPETREQQSDHQAGLL